ncbi:MAG: hypothetical protein ACRCYY_20075 [Trueperaceae bacterium]
MNLRYTAFASQLNLAPWTFSATLTVNQRDVNDKDIISCRVYGEVAECLVGELFKREKLLRDSLRGGLSLQLEPPSLEHYDLEGRFDQAVCNLNLVHRGPGRFSLEAQFLRDATLVTLLRQDGILFFEGLGL